MGECALTLDQEYFDSVNMEVVKRKYYEADKVNAVLREIRSRAESTNRENARLRGEVEAFRGQKAEIGDMLVSARSLARGVVEDANTEADEILLRARTQADAIVREAEQKAEALLRDAQERADALAAAYPDQQEHAARCVERVFENLRQQHLDAVDALNDQWQDFLISLEEDAGEAPADLEQKVGAIARELRALEDQDP